jgi:hypothetical protein
MRATCPVHLIRLDLPNDIWGRVQIIKSQYLKNRPRLVAFKLFPIHHSLITLIFGAILLILVAICQWPEEVEQL